MWAILISILLVMSVVVALEIAGRKQKFQGELPRKIPHALTAIAYAALAFQIEPGLLSLAAGLHLLAAGLAYRFNWFAYAKQVDRKTYGEILFPLGVLLTSLATGDKWFFAAAILTLGLADSAAALVGTKKGKHPYQAFSHKKSYEGSAAFWLTTLIIVAWVVLVAPAGLDGNWLLLVWLPPLMTAVEAVIPYGADNLIVPVAMAAILSSIS